MKYKKEALKFIALFCIELIVFLPFYISDVYADKPVINNIKVIPSHNSAEVTWETDIPSTSVVNYGKDSYVELSKTSSQVSTQHSIGLGPLIKNLQYYYKVKSCSGSDCSSSGVSDFRTTAAPAPSKITGLEDGIITPRSIELKWDASDSEYFDHYIIYKNGDAVATTSGVSYNDKGLSGSTTYMYGISGVNEDGVEGEKSDSLYLTTLVPDIIAPIIKNVSIGSVSSNSVTIEWMTDEDSNSTINYGVGGFDLIKSSTGYGLSHSIILNGLQNDTTYIYSIVSCDIDGNCAEKSDNGAFTPTEVRELNIEFEIPLLHNKAVVPISGTVTPHTKVRFFVNEIYKGLVGMERNVDGNILFDVPGFLSGNNTLKIVVENSIGNTKEQSYDVVIDSAPPAVDITPLPSEISSDTVVVEGSSSEPVNVDIYVALLEKVDTTAPGKVGELHADEIEMNSVELSWIDITDDDFNEYIIYRDGVAIDTSVSSPYEDSYLVSSGKSYRYEIAAIDTSCNVGQKAVLNIKTEAGGVVYEESPEEEIVGCAVWEDRPDYTLEMQYPKFREEISLSQGLNEVIIEVRDEAGNIVKKTYNIYYDSEAPEILEANIEDLSPSYIRDVTVSGVVNEESYVCIYINSEVEVKPYREDEVNESLDPGQSKYCEYTEEDGSFSIDIELRRDAAYAVEEDGQETTMYFTTGTAWTNNIKIIATDRVGLNSYPYEDEIIYSLCGSGGDWSVLVDDVMPTEIVPRHLLEGMAQISFSLDVKYRGAGTKPGIVDIDVREGYPMGMSSGLEEKFDTNWVSQMYDSWSDEYDKGYVLIDLKSQGGFPDDWTTFEKEENLSKHHKGECFKAPFTDKSYLEDAGCVRVPLTIEVVYEKEKRTREKGKWVTRPYSVRQKVCMDVEIFIQPRIPPDMIPDSLLKSSIAMLDGIIEFIDSVLEPLATMLKATMVACFVMWGVLYIKKISEGFSCLGTNVKTCECFATDSGLDCAGSEDEDSCESCLSAKIETKKIEKFMHWTCDRIMCPAVPSYENYIKQNIADESSNCYGKSGPDYDYDNADESYCENLPKGLVGEAIERDKECCDEEYMTEWGAGCVMMNELEESKNLAYPEEDNAFSKIWRTVSDFKLCRPGENEQRQINFGDDGWYIIEENKEYNPELNEDEQTQFKVNVWEGVPKQERKVSLSDGSILSDNTTLTKKTELTGTVIRLDRCESYLEEEGYKYRQGYWPRFSSTSYSETSIITEPVKRLEGFETEDLPKGYSVDDGTENIDVTKDGSKQSVEARKVGVGNDKYFYYDKEGNLIDTSTIDENYYKGGGIKERGSVKSKNIYVPETIVREVCSGVSEDYIVNPADSLFRSIQCVCLSALYSYLKMYRKVLGLIRNCFKTILITGDGSSGACQAVLSYYICDLVYFMFSCFKGYTGFGTGEKSEGILGFFQGIVGSGAEVQQSVENRYGDTNMFKVMFVEKKVIQSACMAFFGADTNIDLMAMAEESMEMPINPTVGIMPANRRFVGYNPIDGFTNHIYHVGLMIVSGSDDTQYNVYLVCSNDNQCDTNNFKNGLCDCSYLGEEITKDITNEFGGNGRLDQGDIINEEAYLPVSYSSYDAKVRYDKIRVEYSYLGNEFETVERKLSQIGGEPLAGCAFDVLSGSYRCSMFEEPSTACITDGPDIEVDGEGIKDGDSIYKAVGEKLTFTFKARRESKKGDKSKAFFGVLKIKDGSRTIVSKELVIDSDTAIDYEFKNIEIKKTWFGSGAVGDYNFKGDSIGVLDVSGTQDVQIESKLEGSTYRFIVTKGTYNINTNKFESESEQGTCTFKQGGSLKQDCEYASITVSSYDDINEGTMIANYQSEATTVDSKELEYSLTMYKPDKDKPSRRSETMTKCNGVTQREEGSFTIYSSGKSEEEKTAAGEDTTKPVISDIKIYDVAADKEITYNTQSDKTLKFVFMVTDDGDNLAEGKIIYSQESEEYTKRIRAKSDNDEYYFTTTMPTKLHEEDVTIIIKVEDAEGNPSEEENIVITVSP